MLTIFLIMANHKLVHYAPRKREYVDSFTFMCNDADIDVSEENVYIYNGLTVSIYFERVLGGKLMASTPYAVPTQSGNHAIGFLITNGSIIPAVCELYYPKLITVKSLENVFLVKQKKSC